MNFDKRIQSCAHCHNQDKELIIPKSCAPLQFISSLHLHSLATTDQISVTIALPFLEGHVNGIIQHVVFYVWFLSHNAFESHPCCPIYQGPVPFYC